MNPIFPYANCFIYALEQYRVSGDKITFIRSYLVGIHVKIQDIGYLGKLLKLGFIIYLARYHIKEEYRFVKLGKPGNNHIIGCKSCQNPILLLIHKDHLMLYDVNITFNIRYYMNT